MKQIINQLSLRLILVAIMAAFSFPAIAQDLTVTGKVTSADNQSIPGASIVVKGTQIGVSADMDGNFSLKTVEGAILQFISIGFATQELSATSNAMNVIMMPDAVALDEVVVTALGIKRATKALGYSVTELKADDLLTNAINPVAALQGKVAGVEIAGSDGGMFGATKIQIRGASTLKGNNQPIYVVDGVILSNDVSGTGSSDWESNANDYGNELKNLNPDDFETISVLKGAAATALYGSRGLNGAVVITTKGTGRIKGLGVSVSQSIGFDHVYKTSQRQMLYGPGNRAGSVAYGEKYDGVNYNKWGNASEFKLNSSDEPSLIGSNAYLWGPRYDGRAIENYDGTITSYSPIKNNYKDAYQLGFNTNTNIAVKGGNETTSFYASASYKNAKGIVENNDFERYSFLLKGSHKLNDWIDINGSVNLAQSKPKNAQTNLGEYYATGTFNTAYDTKYFRNKYLGSHQSGLAHADYADLYANVPGKSIWFKMDNWDETRRETVIRPTLEVNFKLADWVRFRAEGNMNYYFQRAEVKNLGMGYNNTGTSDDNGGKYQLTHNSKHESTYAGTFTFDKAINSDFSIGGFLRGEYYSARYSEQKTATAGGLIVPGQYFLKNSRETRVSEGREYNTKRMLSVVGAINLAWKNQVFLDVTGRNDWSSSLVYPEKHGNYSYFYPSVSGSWLLNETFKLPEWVSLGKVRASWAQVGNDAEPYFIYSGYSLESFLQASGSYIYTNALPEKLYSKELKPERKNSWEVGLDWRFISNRIGFDFTYYKENTKDQIMDIAIPSESGIGKQLINAGNIQNSGIEITLHTVPIRTKDWEWEVDFTYTKNKNKIIELHPNVANYIALEGDVAYGNYRVGSVAKVGGSYGFLMSDSKAMKNANGENVLAWNDGNRAAYAQRSGIAEEVGSLVPDFLGSMTSNLRWKNLSLRVALDMRFGGTVASYTNKYGMAYGYTETSLRYRENEYGGTTWTSDYGDSRGMTFNDGVIPDGVMANGTKVTTVDGRTDFDVSGKKFSDLVTEGILEPVHASSYNFWTNQWGTGTVNDDWLHEVKYIALRDITIAYRLPNSIASKIGAKGLNVSFSARNVGYLYNSLPNKLNPESIRSNKAAEFRERSNAPYVASYIFTVGLDF